MNFLDLTILRPFTKYEIWMRLVRDEEETVRSSERITVTTDGRLPSDTCIKSVKKISEDGILLAWARPTEVYNTVDYYYVRFRFGSGFGTQQLFADCETGWKILPHSWSHDQEYLQSGVLRHLEYLQAPKTEEKCTGTSHENLILATTVQTDTLMYFVMALSPLKISMLFVISLSNFFRFLLLLILVAHILYPSDERMMLSNFTLSLEL